jgi:rare lipoprotein A
MRSWKVSTVIFVGILAPLSQSTFATAADTGTASYYGKGFHGRRAANGEIFDMNAMTAAHRSLPFGTRLQVTNMKNGRSVVVRIQDRGPYIKGRVLDLSYGAARALDMVESGIVKVSYAEVEAPPPPHEAPGDRDRQSTASLFLSPQKSAALR